MPARIKRGTKGPVNRNMPPDVVKMEMKYGKCPKGHVLPHRTNSGRCTPVHCAGSLSGASPTGHKTNVSAKETVSNPEVANAIRSAKAEIIKHLNERADALIDRLLPGETIEMQSARAAAKAQKADELMKIGHQVGRFAAHAVIYKRPENLTGAAAEEFFKREAENLLPDIIVDLKRDLQLGDDTQRREARRDILDIVGKRKADAAPNISNAFVMVAPGGSITVPWSKKGQTLKVVDSTAKSLGPEGPEGSNSGEGKGKSHA